MPEPIILISTAILSSIVGPVVVEFIKSRIKISNKDPLKEAIEHNSVIHDKLSEIQKEFKSDRIWLSQFHNGGYFYPTGKSIQKFSMMYEIVSLDTSSQQQNFQNIPVSLLSKSINHLAKGKNILIHDFKNNTVEDYGLKAISDQSDVKSIYIFPVSSIEGKFIGMCGIEYIKHKTDLSASDMLSLVKHISTIGGTLMNHLQKQ